MPVCVPNGPSLQKGQRDSRGDIVSDKNIQPNSQEVVPVYREHYLLSRDDPISYKKKAL